VNVPSLCSIVLLLGIFPLQAGEEPGRPKLERPIMVDSDGPGSQLFVLDAWGTLHEFRVAKNSLEEFASITLPATLAASDMTYLPAGGQESVLIAGTQMGGESWPDIASMDDNSKLGRFETFALGSTLARAAIPRTWQLQIRTIYRLDLQGTESNYVARIPNATKLGPLAFDEAGRKIFIADLAVGAIYQYSLATKASRVLVSNLSAPTALSFYPETGRLYIADPGRRAIFTVNTRSSQPVLTEFVSEPLKSPYGMALLSSDRMAVADYGANSVLVFSSKAQLLFSFPPKN